MTWWGDDPRESVWLLAMTAAGVMLGLAALGIAAILRPDLVARSILDVMRDRPEDP